MYEEPDFAVMYESSPLEPRMAARLWVVAQMAYDAFRQNMPEMWVEQLPPIAAPLIDEQFVAAFGSRFDILAMRLASGLEETTDLATCTADEVALHLVVDHARDLHSDGALDWEWIEALPRRPRDDDFFSVKDVLFHDIDVLHLYNPAMDGAEDPESEIAQLERFVNLHPRDWFKTFSK